MLRTLPVQKQPRNCAHKTAIFANYLTGDFLVDKVKDYKEKGFVLYYPSKLFDILKQTGKLG